MTPLVAALALFTLPQQPPSPVEEAVARMIAVALPPDAYDWSMDWSPFGVRLGRDVRWHLSEPGQDDEDDLDDGVYRRGGWLPQEGANGDLAVCGDRERVRAVTLSMPDRQLEGEQVVVALRAAGVTVTEVSRQETAPRSHPEAQRADDHYRSMLARAPFRQTWSLEKPGHGDAMLSAEHVCTPPGTRHATVCWTRIRVQFPDADAPAMDCPLPGRWGA